MSARVNWISKYGKDLDSGIAYQAFKQAFPEESLAEDMLTKIGYTANGAGKVGDASKFSSVGSTFAGLGAFLKSIWPVLAVVGGIAAGTAAWKWADDKFTITKAKPKNIQMSRHKHIKMQKQSLVQSSLSMILIKIIFMSFVLHRIEYLMKMLNSLS